MVFNRYGNQLDYRIQFVLILDLMGSAATSSPLPLPFQPLPPEERLARGFAEPEVAAIPVDLLSVVSVPGGDVTTASRAVCRRGTSKDMKRFSTAWEWKAFKARRSKAVMSKMRARGAPEPRSQ